MASERYMMIELDKVVTVDFLDYCKVRLEITDGDPDKLNIVITGLDDRATILMDQVIDLPVAAVEEEAAEGETNYSFVVEEEVCPKCGHDTSKQDAIHFQVIGEKTWETASANPPFGNVTEDEVDEFHPDESIPDLILASKNVVVTCVKCGELLTFTANAED